MPEYLSPGVYIEEQDTGPEPIEGVSTNITGFVGLTQRGPLDTNPPVPVTSFSEFARTFGSYFTPVFGGAPVILPTPYNLLPHAVAGFFNNGGQVLYIKRIGAQTLPPNTVTALSIANGTPATGTYQVNDLLQVTGGTSTTPAVIQVTAVNAAGAITAAVIYTEGSYSANPPTPNGPGNASISGALGATFNLTMGPLVPAAANSLQGLQNAAPSPLLATRLAAPAFSGSTTLYLQSLRGIQNGTQLQLQNGTTTVTTVTVVTYNDANSSVTLQSAIPPNMSFSTASTIVTVPSGGAAGATPGATNFRLNAYDEGAWANTVQLGTQVNSPLQVQIQPSSRASATVLNIAASLNVVVLTTAANFYAGAIVEFNTGTAKLYNKIQAVLGNSIQVVTPFAGTGALTPSTIVRTCEFDVLASYSGVNEAWRGLSLDNTSPYYCGTIINNGSSLLIVPSTAFDNTTPNATTLPVAIDGLNVPMTGGDDGAIPSPNDYIGTDGGPGNRTGLAALVDVEQISLIAIPGITDPATQQAMITQCENLKYRFAILDPQPVTPSSANNLGQIQLQRGQYDTKYAAIYFPSLQIDDPLTGNEIIVPPSGHMAGIYAQTDDTVGVWKAPANVVISGIVGLEVKLSKGDQDILNPEPVNINALRDFTAQDRGLRVYGARCITSDSEWKYINVRRLFIFLEASLDQGTQWAVFEPNDQKLWNRLIQSVSSFLTTVWREGGLMGATADQAFFVKCGYSTMTQDDMDNGRLIMEIGVAPVFPAEFVIIRIGQWAGGSSVQEL